jgi:hypothetical protein
VRINIATFTAGISVITVTGCAFSIAPPAVLIYRPGLKNINDLGVQ